MAYWWVFQSETYAIEKEEGFIWAPLQDKAGKTPFHWSNVKEVKPDDTIFSCVDQEIKAIGIAKTNAYESKRPDKFTPDKSWMEKGLKVTVEYNELRVPLPVDSIRKALLGMLPGKYSPLTKKGTGAEGYLFNLQALAGRFLLAKIEELNN